MPNTEGDNITVIIQALTETFGKHATHVAERQLIDASDETREKWRAIVNRLRRQEARLG